MKLLAVLEFGWRSVPVWPFESQFGLMKPVVRACCRLERRTDLLVMTSTVQQENLATALNLLKIMLVASAVRLAALGIA